MKFLATPLGTGCVLYEPKVLSRLREGRRRYLCTAGDLVMLRRRIISHKKSLRLIVRLFAQTSKVNSVVLHGTERRRPDMSGHHQ